MTNKRTGGRNSLSYKRFFAILLSLAMLCAALAGCGKTEPTPGDHTATQGGEENSSPAPTLQNTQEDTTMYITVNDHTLTVKMADNSSARALLALLENGDITVNAQDYGSFEKVGPLGTELPINDEQITTQPGDLILYQGDQITLYYDTNSWSFTRLGRVQDVTADELRGILGEGDVTMVLSLNGAV